MASRTLIASASVFAAASALMLGGPLLNNISRSIAAMNHPAGYEIVEVGAQPAAPVAVAAAPVDRRELVRSCTDAVLSAQRAWFYRVSGAPAYGGAEQVSAFRSILEAQGFDLSTLEPMPTRDCASLLDGPEQPVDASLLESANRVQLPIPATR